MLAENTLLKTAYHLLLLLVRFDTLTYRKDYDRSPILVGHQTSVPRMSGHMFPPANDDFTRGKSPLVGALNGLSDPKPDPIA